MGKETGKIIWESVANIIQSATTQLGTPYLFPQLGSVTISDGDYHHFKWISLYGGTLETTAG